MIKKTHHKENMAVQEKKRVSMKRKVINKTNIREEKDKY